MQIMSIYDHAVTMNGGDLHSIKVVKQDENQSEKKMFFAPRNFFAVEIEGEIQISIPACMSLTVTNASLSLATTEKNNSQNKFMALLYNGLNASATTVCVLHYKQPTVSGFNLTFFGPSTFTLSTQGEGSISVLGNIHLCDKQVIETRDLSISNESEARHRKRKPEEVKTTATEPQNKDQSGEKVEPTPTIEKINSGSDGTVVKQSLTKRQRRNLAKKKQRELQETVSKLNDHNKCTSINENPKEKLHTVTNTRRLAGGVKVNDFLIGEGAIVKAGRKVSILYKGAFPNGDVFDKNQNRKNPLVFRQGTGQVVRGLELGLEGMRVGGEREISIPPNMGYGIKGSGNVIPPNSTLIFTVKLIAA